MKLYVYNELNRIVGIVTYNNILDNERMELMNCHRGITKLKTGEYVLIDSDETHYKAYTVSDYIAFEAILDSGHDELLDEAKFLPLRRFLSDLSVEA